MEIEYKYWEKDAGFEESQAKIYMANNPGQQIPVTAKDIATRFKNENIDPKTVMYAYVDDKAMAYVQARDYDEPKETHLGYPWALPECPEEVQHKLFDDMLAYIKTRDVGYDIRVNGYANNEKVMNFIKSKSTLNEIGQNFRHELDVKQLSQMVPPEGDYTIRKANMEDVDILVQLIKEDGRYTGQFSKDEEIAEYFSERVLPANHCFMAFKDDNLVMATAPLVTTIPGDSEERLILRFHSFLPDNDKALLPLLIQVAKECVATPEMESKNLAMFEGFGDSQTVKDSYKKLNPVKTEITGLVFAPAD